MLLRRLGSSVPAFRAALTRHDAYLDLAARASEEGRALTPREFQRCFPRAAESDIQLVLFPLLLDHGGDSAGFADDRVILARLRGLLARAPAADPKQTALEAFTHRSRYEDDCLHRCSPHGALSVAAAVSPPGGRGVRTRGPLRIW